MWCFVKIGNSYKAITSFVKSPFLDVSLGPECVSDKRFMYFLFPRTKFLEKNVISTSITLGVLFQEEIWLIRGF